MGNEAPKPSPKGRKPRWLRRRLPTGPEFERIRTLLRDGRLHTVCQEARCPNLWECFSARTATFLILGAHCTRNCSFCAVEAGPPDPTDPSEPERVAGAVETMELGYVVVTSVTRDDLPDGGAKLFAATISAIRRRRPETRVEVLIPDFQGDLGALQAVLAARPDVLNHNLETVPSLYAAVRPEADYHRSLELLRRSRRLAAGIPTKSGLMLGLGETAAELRRTLKDLHATGCRMLTLGQYLQPTPAHLPVVRYVQPIEFDAWRRTAHEMGFREVASAPLVRSSYQARELYAEGNPAPAAPAGVQVIAAPSEQRRDISEITGSK